MTSSLDTKNTASLDSTTSQKTIIEDAFSSDVTQWSEKTKDDTIRSVIADLDSGDLRIAHLKTNNGTTTHGHEGYFCAISNSAI